MDYVWIHVSEGTQINAWRFRSEEDAIEFRAKYADDDQADGSRRSVDDLPPLPLFGKEGDALYGQRDNQETDTWIMVICGQVARVDGELVADGQVFLTD